MNKFWKFEDRVSKEGSDLYIEGVIAEETWWGDEVTPDSFRNELQAQKGDITVHINSPGGDVFAGITIYNALKDYKKGKVIVKVDGIAASSASVIALGGDELVMSPGSMLMIHGAAVSLNLAQVDEVQSCIDLLKELNDSIANIYCEETNLPKDEIVDMMDKETYMTAEKAVELGFADRVANDEPVSKMVMYKSGIFTMCATRKSEASLYKKICENGAKLQNNSKGENEMSGLENNPKVQDDVTETEAPETETPMNEVDAAETEAPETETPAETPSDETEGGEAEDTENAEAETEAPADGEDEDKGGDGMTQEEILDTIQNLKDDNEKKDAEIAELKNQLSAKQTEEKSLQQRLTSILSSAKASVPSSREGAAVTTGSKDDSLATLLKQEFEKNSHRE